MLNRMRVTIGLWVMALGMNVSFGQPLPSLVESDVESKTELVFTEGPAYHGDGSVFFTDIANNINSIVCKFL